MCIQFCRQFCDGSRYNYDSSHSTSFCFSYAQEETNNNSFLLSLTRHGQFEIMCHPCGRWFINLAAYRKNIIFFKLVTKSGPLRKVMHFAPKLKIFELRQKQHIQVAYQALTSEQINILYPPNAYISRQLYHYFRLHAVHRYTDLPITYIISTICLFMKDTTIALQIPFEINELQVICFRSNKKKQ